MSFEINSYNINTRTYIHTAVENDDKKLNFSNIVKFLKRYKDNSSSNSSSSNNIITDHNDLNDTASKQVSQQ
jgi:hypothetical protein